MDPPRALETDCLVGLQPFKVTQKIRDFSSLGCCTSMLSQEGWPFPQS